MVGDVMGFSLRRSAKLAAALGTGVLTVWIIAALGSLGVTDFKNSGSGVPLQDGSEAPLSVESESLYAPHVVVDADTGPSVAANEITETWDEPEAAATAVGYPPSAYYPYRAYPPPEYYPYRANPP